MDKSKVFWEDLGVTAEISAFTPQDKIEEFHVMLHVEPRAELFDGQLKRIYEGEERLLRLPQVMGADVILKRYFLSDSTNQQPLMKQEADCSVSVIQQPPLDGSKVLFSLLPDSAYAWLMRYERYGMILLYILLFADVLDTPLNFLRTGLLNGLSSAVSFLIGLFV